MTELKRILAFDVGDRRIGIAVSDLLGITAQPVETYTRTDDENTDIRYLLSVAEKYQAGKLVFGLPRNMNGTYGFQSEKVKAFAGKLLEGWNGEYDFYDERLTTVTAERILLEADVSRKKRKKVVDKIAAVVILQNYLDSRGNY